MSIVIPVYKGGEPFRALLSSLQVLNPAPHEVILVLDGAHPDDLLAAGETTFTVMTLPTRSRPSAVRNAGVRAASGDWIVFLDADVTAPPGLLGQISAALAADPAFDALIGSYDDAPARSNFLSQYKNLLHHYVHQRGNAEASTFWGACGAIKREVFWAVGGYDESWHFIEDIELGVRLRKAGYRIRLCKDIQIKHWKAYTLVSLLRSDILHRALPWSLLILREGQVVDDLNTNLSSRASVVLSGLLVLTLALGFWQPILWFTSLICFVLLYWLNHDTYHFLRDKRGSWFAIRAIPCHILYYLYSGMTFAAAATLIRIPGGAALLHRLMDT